MTIRIGRRRVVICDLPVHSYSFIHLLRYNSQKTKCSTLRYSITWVLTTVDTYVTNTQDRKHANVLRKFECIFSSHFPHYWTVTFYIYDHGLFFPIQEFNINGIMPHVLLYVHLLSHRIVHMWFIHVVHISGLIVFIAQCPIMLICYNFPIILLLMDI